MPQNWTPDHWLASYGRTMPTVPESTALTSKIMPASQVLNGTWPPSGGTELKSIPKPAPQVASPPPLHSRKPHMQPPMVPASVTGNACPSGGVIAPGAALPADMSRIGGSELGTVRSEYVYQYPPVALAVPFAPDMSSTMDVGSDGEH